MVIYTFLLPQMKLVFHDSFFIYISPFVEFVIELLHLGLLPSVWRRAQIKKKRYCVITVSIIVFNNKFHLNREIHSAGRPELNVIYRFFFRFVLTCRFISTESSRRRKALSRSTEEWNHKFVKVAFSARFFSPCEPSINARAMVNVISFMLENEQ